MKSAIDHVAAAIAEANSQWEQENNRFDASRGEAQFKWGEAHVALLARAAVLALRHVEPTAAMTDAGYSANGNEPASFPAIWGAMIDAALDTTS